MSSLIYQGLNFITLILITRRLGEDIMGQFALLQSTIIMLLSFGILGLNVSATTLIARFKSHYPNQIGLLVGNSYLITSVAIAVVTLLSFVFYGKFFGTATSGYSETGWMGLFLIIWLATMTFDMLQVSVLVGFEAFRDIIKTDIAKGIFTIIAILPLSYLFGLPGVVSGYAVSSLIGLSINQWFVRRNLRLMGSRVDFRFRPVLVGKLLGIGVPVFIASAFISPTIWITNKLIFNQPGGAYVLGIIFVCRQLLVLFQFAPVQISKVTLPLISRTAGTGDEKRFKIVSISISMVSCMVLAAAGILFEDIILGMYKVDIEVARLPYRIIIILLFFTTLNNLIGLFAIAGRNPWNRTYADLINSAVMLTATIILLRINLLVALPISMLIAFIFSDIFLIFSTRREIPGLTTSVNGES